MSQADEDKDELKDRVWERGWEDQELQQLQRLAKLSMAEKLDWLEEAQRLAVRMGGNLSKERGTKPTSITPMLQHTLTFRVRYPEADPMGFVHHSRYLQYFEMGRVELLRAQGFSYADLERQGVFFAVTKAQVQYRAPARFDDELTLLTRIVRQTTVRIDHEYTLRRGETVIAEGSTTIACLDGQGQLRHIPESLGGPQM